MDPSHSRHFEFQCKKSTDGTNNINDGRIPFRLAISGALCICQNTVQKAYRVMMQARVKRQSNTGKQIQQGEGKNIKSNNQQN